MKVTFAYEELKISEDECWQILDDRNSSTESFDMSLSDRGNRRMMLVGFNQDARLLEVGLEYFEADDEVYRIHVFHGMKATSTYERLYSERIGK